MTFVKICGITRLDDAVAALERGADALGFVFWPGSPRRIDPVRAREIVAALPAPAVIVGVLVNEEPERVNEIARIVGLNAVQLHGDETPASIAVVRRPIIKALSGGAIDARAAEWPRNMPMLVDAHDPAKRGGTGMKADWRQASALAMKRRVLLAGGLTPDNVARAVAEVRPYGIDVSSGVETAPGIKDRTKLDALFRALEAVTR
jgi:phosphoribosylanthranilate isomerase